MGEIFMKLLNMSIMAGWMILAVLCIRFLFRKIPKWVICLLWGAVAIRLLIPFSIESEFSLQPSAEPVKQEAVVQGETVSYVPSVDSKLAIVDDIVNPMLEKAFAYQETESAVSLQAITQIAGLVWLCGAAMLLIVAAVSMQRLYLCVSEAVQYKENIYICDTVRSPFILGIIAPKIYLSSALYEEEIHYIIAHERAHLQRKDHVWKLFGYLLLCVYWFNPLCWLAYIMLCKDIELACDEKVIKSMSFADKKNYSKVLLASASERSLILGCPLAFGEVGVKERVKTVLKYKRPAFLLTITALAVCAVVAVCFLTNPSDRHRIRVTIPAGSTETFCYSDEEICPRGNTITITSEEGTGDTRVILYPEKDEAEKVYEAVYMTQGLPVQMDAESGVWFKIGIDMPNPTPEDIEVYVSVRNVEVRSALAEEKDKKNLSESEQKEPAEEKAQENKTQGEEQNAADEDMQRELERIVSSIGLENAFPWNNTVELSSNTNALIKMAGDETGRFEIYGIMSEKYGTYGLLLNDGKNGEQNWNYAYVPWFYIGGVSGQPILEKDGNGKYVFAYIYKYDDVPLWREYILDCGYDTGHMELLLQEEAGENTAVREDYYEMAVSMPAEEVESFALEIKEDILNGDWTSLSEKIAYPILIDGLTLNNSSDFLALDFGGKRSGEFIAAINAESCREMFCNWQGIMMGESGQIWLAKVLEDGTWKLKIIGINGLLDDAEEKNI